MNVSVKQDYINVSLKLHIKRYVKLKVKIIPTFFTDTMARLTPPPCSCQIIISITNPYDDLNILNILQDQQLTAPYSGQRDSVCSDLVERKLTADPRTENQEAQPRSLIPCPSILQRPPFGLGCPPYSSYLSFVQDLVLCSSNTIFI